MSIWQPIERLAWAALGGFIAILLAIGIGRIKAIHPIIKVWVCRIASLKMIIGLLWGIKVQMQSTTHSQWPMLPPILGIYLLACWLVGVILVGTSFLSSLQAVRKVYALTTLHDGWASIMFAKQTVVREVVGLTEPCVCGIFRPSLILPKGWKYKQGILVHEWAHIKHGDLQWNALSWLTYALFWFVPGQAKLNAEMNLWQEVRADLVARERLGVSASSQAKALLLAVEKSRLPAPLMLGQAGHAATVARRLEALYSKRYNIAACWILAISVAAFCIPIQLSRSNRAEVHVIPTQPELSIANFSR